MSLDAPLRAPLHLVRETRYSRFVALMKVLLPSLAVGLLLMLLVWPQMQKRVEEFKVGYTEGVSASGPVMTNARFVGTDAANRPYSVTADRAEQLPADEEAGAAVRLEGLMGDITLKDGAWLSLDAARGMLRRDDNVLVLEDSVDLFHDRGWELHTDAARLDLAEGRASGDKPVRFQGPFGHGRGEGFRIGPEGRTVTLTGRSRLVIRGAKEKSP